MIDEFDYGESFAYEGGSIIRLIDEAKEGDRDYMAAMEDTHGITTAPEDDFEGSSILRMEREINLDHLKYLVDGKFRRENGGRRMVFGNYGSIKHGVDEDSDEELWLKYCWLLKLN